MVIQPVGTHVFIDGVSQPGQPAMTCATALAEVQQAHDLGAAAGFWGADQPGDSRSLEFLNSKTVDNGRCARAWRLASWGYTVSGIFSCTHVCGRVYFWDQPGLAIQLSTITLLHEQIHMAYGEGDHCRWANKVCPGAFSAFGPAQTASNFTDGCTGAVCSGSECSK